MTEEEGAARGEPSLEVLAVAGAELVLPPSCTQCQGQAAAGDRSCDPSPGISFCSSTLGEILKDCRGLGKVRGSTVPQ